MNQDLLLFLEPISMFLLDLVQVHINLWNEFIFNFILNLFVWLLEVVAKKGTTSEGEQYSLEITSCQWQNDSWLEIKNPVVKYSDGYIIFWDI